MEVDDHPKTPFVDEHQISVDKLTFALNKIEMECGHEDDSIVKEKLTKHASNIKLQLSQIITLSPINVFSKEYQ
uniref:Uncharacterized protein n=1 Tax=Romanomermis culicivorax TaxID=13658 RepID=A0A915IRC4_ROMCU